MLRPAQEGMLGASRMAGPQVGVQGQAERGRPVRAETVAGVAPVVRAVPRAEVLEGEVAVRRERVAGPSELAGQQELAQAGCLGRGAWEQVVGAVSPEQAVWGSAVPGVR